MRTLLLTMTLLASMLVLQVSAATPAITVYKDPSCSCCAEWVKHLQANGFQVTVREVQNLGEYRQKYGVSRSVQSCHTAVIDGYTIEGHVPAAEIHRLLKERPQAKGLAVPGMPVGSPGMENRTGRRDSYSVVLFQANGTSSIYRHYPAQ